MGYPLKWLIYYPGDRKPVSLLGRMRIRQMDEVINVEKIDSSRFHRVYPNLPLMERPQVCCVIEDEPISWKLARKEIIANTRIGKLILIALAKMELI